jgi:hypothetical protein
VSYLILLVYATDVLTKVYSHMANVVLLLLFAWLISTAVMTFRSGAELREREASFNPRQLSTITAPMRPLSAGETGERVQ